MLKHFGLELSLSMEVIVLRIVPLALAVQQLAQSPDLVGEKLLTLWGREVVTMASVGKSLEADPALDH